MLVRIQELCHYQEEVCHYQQEVCYYWKGELKGLRGEKEKEAALKRPGFFTTCSVLNFCSGDVRRRRVGKRGALRAKGEFVATIHLPPKRSASSARLRLFSPSRPVAQIVTLTAQRGGSSLPRDG